MMRRLRLARWRAGKRSGVSDALRQYWEASVPAPGTPIEAVPWLVCDGEMTGLDPAKDELISLGWVAMDGDELAFASGRHELIRAEGSVGVSATIHQIRDCELEAASHCREVLEQFLAAAAGRVVVFHHAPLDTAFLDRAATELLGAPLLLPTVDTLHLEKRLLERRDAAIKPGDLRLQACRGRYGLPDHAAHNALEDAMATAELLLAHIACRGSGLRLRDLT